MSSQPIQEPQNALPPPAVPGVQPRGAGREAFGGVTEVLFSRVTGYFGLVGLLLGGIIFRPTGMGVSLCSMQARTGLPCPGCGLTRSVTSFLQGHFAWSFAYHPMGFVFALFFLSTGVMAVLPTKWRNPVLRALSKHDGKLGVFLVVYCVLLVVYGLFRIYMVHIGASGYEWWAQPEGVLPPFVDQ